MLVLFYYIIPILFSCTNSRLHARLRARTSPRNQELITRSKQEPVTEGAVQTGRRHFRDIVPPMTVPAPRPDAPTGPSPPVLPPPAYADIIPIHQPRQAIFGDTRATRRARTRKQRTKERTTHSLQHTHTHTYTHTHHLSHHPPPPHATAPSPHCWPDSVKAHTNINPPQTRCRGHTTIPTTRNWRVKSSTVTLDQPPTTPSRRQNRGNPVFFTPTHLFLTTWAHLPHASAGI